ncbi:Methyltransferase domain-containing protein [Desulfacinum hydrothermale DSM 13146]|uniref:Methyltransferase domain-containing protein n=1 Tax=Desulfacinum hydrothermale DSM 13146 TaxID=1121390 RepID=A0A1W1XLW7_9BACT|nr:class I SAM-dependent methyltransferase [Desulfacinum hydrothermale]SMC24980.1 Methyltransferase domain-containing protein [Desulfacinum hydrothermale DSM 13146]
MDRRDRVRWICSSKDNDELRRRYDQWADGYDQDLLEVHGYRGPEKAVAQLTQFVSDSDALILDAGCGTGLVGELLCEKGYKNLVGIDLSEGMLRVASQKSVYKTLQTMTLGEPLAFPDRYFDAVISVGVFTQGHAPPKAFDELVRITRPNGTIVFTLRCHTYTNCGFQEKFQALEQAGRWTLEGASTPFPSTPGSDPHTCVQVWAFRRLGP